MDSALIMTRVSAQTRANKGFVELALIRMMSPARMSCDSRTTKAHQLLPLFRQSWLFPLPVH